MITDLSTMAEVPFIAPISVERNLINISVPIFDVHVPIEVQESIQESIQEPVKTKPKICLSMIERNEAHILMNTLKSVAPFIDYAVIVDTGSKDNSKEIIQQFSQETGIPVEIHDREWIDDFGFTRTEALNLCAGKGDYVWIIDADNPLIGEIDFTGLDKDAYELWFKGHVLFSRCQIFKNNTNIKWMWHDILHEFLAPAEPGTQFTYGKIEGNYYIQDFHLGDRSKNPLKYFKDAMVLEGAKGVRARPDYPRYRFYLAQSWMADDKQEYAIINYKKRIAMGGWIEEVYQSYYQIGVCTKILFLKKEVPKEDVIDAFMKAHKYNQARAEPLYELGLFYKDILDFENGYKYLKMASAIPKPVGGLFIDYAVYDYKITADLALCSYYTRRYDESFLLNTKLANMKNIPQEFIDLGVRNTKWDIDSITKMYQLVYTISNTIIV